MSAIDRGECERRVFLSEGGYTNDPRDPGGPTNWGITLVDARLHWKADATAEDVRNMPRAVAEEIYKTKYWDALNCDKLPPGLDYTIFDYGVNSGIGRSSKVLRHLMGLGSNDWHIDSEVLRRVASTDIKKLIDEVNDERLAFLEHLSTWDHFGPGWGRRVASVKQFSEHLYAAEPHAATPAPYAPDTMAKAYASDDTPVAALPIYTDPATPVVDASYETTSELPIEPKVAPSTPEAGGMFGSDTGWASIGIGASAALSQVNDMMSQIAEAKFNLMQFADNPKVLLAVCVVGAAAFIWFDHRKYKRLVRQLQEPK